MKKTRWLLIIFITIGLYGCVETPSEVLEDIDSYHSAEETVQNDAFHIVPFSTMDSDIENALDQNYGQFHLANSITITVPETLNIMTFQIMDHFEDHYLDVFAGFFTQNELEELDIDYKENIPTYEVNGHSYQGEYITYSYEFNNESEKLIGIVNNLGHVCVIKPSSYDAPFVTDEETMKVYHVDRGDDLSDSYPMKDGEITVSDAVDFTNQWLADSMHQFEADFEQKVKTVVVKKIDDNYQFEITVHKLYKGVPLNSYQSAWETDDATNLSYIRYYNTTYSIEMNQVNEIDSFTSGGCLLNKVAEESVTEYISLESALSFCQSTFTDFQDIEISDINILYTLSPEYDYIGEEYFDGDTSFRLNQPIPSAGIIMNSRPVWEFVIDVAPESYLQEGEINTYGDVHKYIYVDMLTGELFYQLETEL